jgi:Ca2+-transporting ATPase
MHVPPKRKDESIVTPAMVKTIFITAAFFVVVMLALLLGMEHFAWFAAGSGPAPAGWEFEPLTVRQVTIFFTVYIFFQVWNQINCRSLVPEESGLRGLTRNPTFLLIAGTVAVVQVLIVSVPFLGTVFKVEPLGLWDWLWIVTGTASVLLFGEAVRRLRTIGANL